MSYNVKGEQRNTGRTHFKKGFTPWNKNKKGVYSEEYRRKISDGGKGRTSPMKGVKHSDETKQKIKKARKAQINVSGPKGKPWSAARKNAQIARNGKPYIIRHKRKSVLKNLKPLIKNGKEYHPLWHEIRKLIYKRDNWNCQECGVKCHNNIRINCHHIDYDVTNNDFNNLITLCASCHAKTNFKRIDWTLYFKAIQNNKEAEIIKISV